MQTYAHRQSGTLVRITMGAACLLVAVLFVLIPEARLVLAPALVVMLALLVLFHSLVVTLEGDELRVAFGPGLIRRRFRLADVRSARAVTSPWYWGWGIRLTPRGWMFNVSGFAGVELELSSGRHFRIGTDDPSGLVAAIERAKSGL